RRCCTNVPTRPDGRTACRATWITRGCRESCWPGASPCENLRMGVRILSTISPDRELRKSLQELGENSAYTAKGLFKMADTLAILYASCLCTSFTLSVIVLAFPKSSVVQPASAVALIL